MLRNRLVTTARSLLERLERKVRSAREPAVAPTPAVAPAPEPQPEVKPKPVNWELRSQGDLVDHIIGHYHEGLRRDLPILIATSRTVVRDNKGHAENPGELTDLLEALANDLESHMLKEERMLFPQLRTGQRGGPVDMPIRMMEREHEGHDESLAQIRAATRELTAPADASDAWRKLYADIAALEAALREHIYLENNVLFARAMGGEY
jgi:regulator of cell morphogenesis and NO signaling